MEKIKNITKMEPLNLLESFLVILPFNFRQINATDTRAMLYTFTID